MAILLASILGSGSTARAGLFAENWDAGAPPNVVLSGSATATGGKVVLTTNAGAEDGRVTLANLDPGQAVASLYACTTLFIGNGTGADGFSFNFGDPGSIVSPADGVTSGFAVSLDTYDNGSGDAFDVVQVLYDGVVVETSPSANLRTGNFVSLCVTVLADGQFAVRHNNTVVSGTISGWTASSDRVVTWAAATGGLADEHSIDGVTVVTIPTTTFFEPYTAAPANTTFHGSARHDDFYARLTDNASGQVGSAIVQDQDPGVAIDSFAVTFAKYIWNGGGADGVSFNFGDLADAAWGEGGSGSGLTVSWPTYQNDKIKVYYGGSEIVTSGPRELRGQWSRVSISVDPSGTLAISEDNDGDGAVAVIATIPGWNPAPGWRFGFGGRTGGVADDQAFTQLSIETAVCGDGAVGAGELCDEGLANGTTASCCSSTCSFKAAATECRGAASACDEAEVCSGISAACPADTFAGAGTACGDVTDDGCTNPDSCDGSGACLGNHETAGVSCGDATDDACTDADSCDGTGACLDNDEMAGFSCGDSTNDACTNPDSCDGSGACLDNHETAGVSCGDATDGVCTNPDSCDGVGACGANHEPATTACRLSTGVCDEAEFCSGNDAICPEDGGSTCPPSVPAGSDGALAMLFAVLFLAAALRLRGQSGRI
ncbi:MAG: hypothetical protein P8R42_04690 [Candidatus Binatia bacterium]|nr:hypothetical protein [Candidatus Binatia bacterium]